MDFNKQCLKYFFGVVFHQEMLNDDLCVRFFASFDDLSEKEYAVISLRYGLEDGKPKSISEIANYYEVKEETIKKVEASAIKKLRHPIRSTSLVNMNK